MLHLYSVYSILHAAHCQTPVGVEAIQEGNGMMVHTAP